MRAVSVYAQGKWRLTANDYGLFRVMKMYGNQLVVMFAQLRTYCKPLSWANARVNVTVCDFNKAIRHSKE